MQNKTQTARDSEIAKYTKAYESPKYRMGDERKKNSQLALERFQTGTSYLDIGAGRCEMLDFSATLGLIGVGTEVVPELLAADPRLVFAQAHQLPFSDQEFDMVSSFDVLEHLIEQDVDQSIAEIFRVAGHRVLVSAASDSQCWKGIEQHPSRRPLTEWSELLVKIGKRMKWSLRESLPCRKNSGLWVFVR